LIFPSRFEGLSNVVVESLLAGCFVYLSNIPENQVFSRFSDRVKFFENTNLGISNVIQDINSSEPIYDRQKFLVEDVQDFFSLSRCVSQYKLNFEK
jgi:glycosyltransferase involved in cell wall biosynthesis